jgi:TPR repeat protein
MAADYLKKAVAQDNVLGQLNLALLYYEGQGVEQSYSEAFRLLKLAAESGLAAAEYNVGVMYYKGEGVEASVEEAKKWITRAAEQGYEDAVNALKEIK